MAYWHRLRHDGWTCPECGTRQFGEYECESDWCASMRQIDDEADVKRARRDAIKVAIMDMTFLAPRVRRRWLKQTEIFE